MQSILIESHYLPSIAYFAAISHADELLLERHENFQKQTFRNRCYINSSQGVIPLIVPLANTGGKRLITEIQIDYSQRWLNNHWRAIQSSYGKAPFFEHYSVDLHDTLFRKFDRLFELNQALLTLCLKWLKIKIPVRGTFAFEKTPSQAIYDLRSTISPKNPQALAQIYEPAVYHQVFGNMFVPNLSLIDLIFCKGPGAWDIVQASSPK
ncbi:MAG TPA: WbqC family protein [Chryseosolibacter sp.]